MDVRGLLLVGTYLGTEQVKKRDGTSVPNLMSVRVDCASSGGEPWVREASFFTTDRDTGQATTFSKHLEEVAPEPGDLVAIRIKTRVSGSWVNYDALAISVLTGELVQ